MKNLRLGIPPSPEIFHHSSFRTISVLHRQAIWTKQAFSHIPTGPDLYFRHFAPYGFTVKFSNLLPCRISSLTSFRLHLPVEESSLSIRSNPSAPPFSPLIFRLSSFRILDLPAGGRTYSLSKPHTVERENSREGEMCCVDYDRKGA